jgi:hypothetical protein
VSLKRPLQSLAAAGLGSSTSFTTATELTCLWACMTQSWSALTAKPLGLRPQRGQGGPVTMPAGAAGKGTKKLVYLMTPGAQLQHACHELGLLFVTRISHLVQLLYMLDVS